ncbi:MAG: hypothetical protein HOP08_18410 [Cyclobacteriaceae bacterium]|nr:hypothetical protein [Cyclobacteriaceae bacterium]
MRIISNDSLGKDYNRQAIQFKLRRLSPSDKIELTDSFFGKSLPYDAYFYSKQSAVNQSTPILVLANADDYQSVIMFVMSSKQVLDRLELTLHSCDAVSQGNGKEVVNCHDRYSKFLNDSTIQLTDLKISINDYEKIDEITTMDSLSIDYRITSEGKIVQVKKDSIRSVKKKT